MKVYSNGVEWVVAESPEDAIKVWEETIGEKYDADEYDPFEEKPDGKVLKIGTEDIDDDFLPKDAMIRQVSDYVWEVTATMREWVDANGRGYLCTSEW